MEAKMLHSAVSSKPMTKHRDGERSAVRTLDKTSVVRCCFFVGGKNKQRENGGPVTGMRWLVVVGFDCFVFFFGWLCRFFLLDFFCWGLGFFFGGVKANIRAFMNGIGEIIGRFS